MLICWAHFYGHSITVVWGLETVAKEVAEGVWKLLLHGDYCKLSLGNVV